MALETRRDSASDNERKSFVAHNVGAVPKYYVANLDSSSQAFSDASRCGSKVIDETRGSMVTDPRRRMEPRSSREPTIWKSSLGEKINEAESPGA